MGLTNQASGFNLFQVEVINDLPLTGDYTVALAGNPNVGKSTVFNALTGLRQHTGNWPGKTVASARGLYTYKDKQVVLVDLPGAYSLLPNSVEEEIARDFILFGQPDTTVVVTDATCLERNLNLILQVIEITARVVVCLNLIDEAQRKRIKINVAKLEEQLGVPVVPTAARNEEGLEELKETINAVATDALKPRPKPVEYPPEIESQIERLVPTLERLLPKNISSRWAALRIIEQDQVIIEKLQELSREQSICSQEVYKYGRVI